MTDIIEIQFDAQVRYREALELILNTVNTMQSLEEKVYTVREMAKGALK